MVGFSPDPEIWIFLYARASCIAMHRSPRSAWLLPCIFLRNARDASDESRGVEAREVVEPA
jgi:hypothetical protein